MKYATYWSIYVSGKFLFLFSIDIADRKIDKEAVGLLAEYRDIKLPAHMKKHNALLSCCNTLNRNMFQILTLSRRFVWGI